MAVAEARQYQRVIFLDPLIRSIPFTFSATSRRSSSLGLHRLSELRLAMAGRLNPPPSRGRRLSWQVSDAPRLVATKWRSSFSGATRRLQ